MLKDGTEENYMEAAVRHYLDAERLCKLQRFDNAGHLIGFAAECAIKYKIRALPISGDPTGTHLPELLHAARKRLGERAGYHSMYNLLKDDSFEDWHVSFRYAPTGKITKSRLTIWFKVTQRLLAAANVKVRLP